MKKILLPFFIALFIISGCETEKLTTKFANDVELAYSDEYASLIPFEFAVDWQSGKKDFSDEFNSEIIEFDVIWTGNYNPDDIYLARKRSEVFKDSNYKIFYKIIALKVGESYTFYSVKFTTDDEIALDSYSLLALDKLDGYFSIYNKENEVISSKKYIEGQFLLSLLKEKGASTKRCYDVTLVNTYYYYNVRENGVLELNFTRTTSEMVTLCEGDNHYVEQIDYIDDGDLGTGGAPPIYVSEDVVLDDLFYADCSSFEYAKGLNGAILGASVLNVSNIFYTYNYADPLQSSSILIDFPVLFFSMPGGWNEGFAANKTATAVSNSMEIAADWYYDNPNATTEQLATKWWNVMKSEMNKVSGQVTNYPLFTVPSPSIFKQRFFGTGNCM